MLPRYRLVGAPRSTISYMKRWSSEEPLIVVCAFGFTFEVIEKRLPGATGQDLRWP